MYSKTNLMSLTLFCLVSISAVAAGNAKVKGMIMSRTGETLIVKSAQGNVTVVLTENTTTKDDTGMFGLSKDKLSSVVLIPGLKVSVDGTSDKQGQIVATTITVDGDDLETSEMIQAGLHPTAQQVAVNVNNIDANKLAIERNKQNVSSNSQQIKELEKRLAAQNKHVEERKQKIEVSINEVEETTKRFTALAEYEVKADATVKFGVGSTTLSTEDGEGLKTLADKAKGLTGYIIEVTGYADSTGDAAMNTKLSEDRAKSVITFLMQQGGVPVRHIVAPGAMGEYGPAASNETDAGRADNRRVEVKVLVNKGIAGK